MYRVPANFARLTVLIGSQIVILAFGYGFLVAVAYLQYLAPIDPVCELMKDFPGELTMLVTLIATALSVTTATSVFLLLSPLGHSVRRDFFY
jgi:hypothetical protein